MFKICEKTLLQGLLALTLGFALAWMTPVPARGVPIPVVKLQDLTHPVWTRAKCGAVCTVTYSPGGVIEEYQQQVENIKRDKITLKIDGKCVSACTMAVDKARDNVCITPNASLMFHRGTEIRQFIKDGMFIRVERRVDVDQYYSDDIKAWVKAHGGFPGKDMSEKEQGAFLTMSFEEARHFFKVCK